MDADCVRRIRCDGRHHNAQPVSGVQYGEHDHLQYARVFGVRFTYEDNVLGSGSFFVSIGGMVGKTMHLLIIVPISREPFQRVTQQKK